MIVIGLKLEEKVNSRSNYVRPKETRLVPLKLQNVSIQS